MILGAYGWVETTDGVAEQPEAALDALHWSVTLVPAGILALSIGLLLGLYRPLARRVLDVV